MYFSTTIIWDLIAYAKTKGVNTHDLEVELSVHRNQKYVGYPQLIQTLNFMDRCLEDEHLGLHVGEEASLNVTAPVDNIMMYSQTLEASVNNAIKYSKLISDALECSLEITEDHYSVIYQENPNWKVQQAYAKKQILDLALLSNVKSLAAYTQHQYYPVRIDFNYERPKSLREYYRLFNCSLKFNQPRAQILFEKQIIYRHSKQIEYRLLESIKAKVTNEIDNLDLENELIYRLKKSILNFKPYRISVDEAANELNLSSRTLQRKLKVLHTSFKKVEYDIQLKLAKTYLEENQKSVDEISYLLGFSECSAFTRFFKSLTSLSPLEYRGTVD